MNKIKIKIRKRKITKVGHSYGFIIPKQYVDDGLLEENVDYDVVLNTSVGGGSNE